MSWYNNFFTFTKGEKRGVIVLLSLIILILFFSRSLKFLIKKDRIDFSQYEQEIDQLKDTITKEPKLLKFDLVNFNPNTATDTLLLNLGFKAWQVKAINKYKLKGGEYRLKKDVKSIYGVTDSMYKALEPYILLPDTYIYEKRTLQKENYKVKNKSYNKEKKKLIVELNTAKQEDLKKIKGIGEVFSSRIIKYRNLLGGYYSVNQLSEVYGMSEQTLSMIKENITVNTKNVEQISVNLSSVNQLKKHPYITWNIANAIVNYRKQHGNFTKLEDLQKIHLINEKEFSRIKPYLTL